MASLDRKELAIGTAFLSAAALGLVLVPLTSSGAFTARLLAVLEDNGLGLEPLACLVLVVVAGWPPLRYGFRNLRVVQHHGTEHRTRTRVAGTSDLSAMAAPVDYLRFLATSSDPEPTLRRAQRVAFAASPT